MADKIYKVINKLFIFLILGGALYYAIFHFSSKRIVTYLCSILVVLVPFVLDELNFRLKERDRLIYYSFVFLAYFLGSVVNLYKYIEWLDTVVHFISGVFSCYLGFYILNNFFSNCKNNKVFSFLFCIGFVFMVAGLWEFLEFTIDKVTLSNMQHSLETGVSDTMVDMMSASVGGVVYFLIHLFLLKKSDYIFRI